MNKKEAKEQGEKLLKKVQEFEPKAFMKITHEAGVGDASYYYATVYLCEKALTIWQGSGVGDYFCNTVKLPNYIESAKTPKSAFLKLYRGLDKHFLEVDDILEKAWVAQRNIENIKLGIKVDVE